MKTTAAQDEDFDVYARDPNNWIFAARRALAVAHVLMARVGELQRLPNHDVFEFSGCLFAGYFSRASL